MTNISPQSNKIFMIAIIWKSFLNTWWRTLQLLMPIQNCNQKARFPERIIGYTNKFTSKQGSLKLSIFQTSSDMIYYSLDPQFATLLFSVYSRNERTGFSIIPDTFNFSTSIPSSSSVLAYAQTVGLQLIALGEHYANFFSQG